MNQTCWHWKANWHNYCSYHKKEEKQQMLILHTYLTYKEEHKNTAIFQFLMTINAFNAAWLKIFLKYTVDVLKQKEENAELYSLSSIYNITLYI